MYGQVESVNWKTSQVEKNIEDIQNKLKNISVQNPDLVNMILKQNWQSTKGKVDDQKVLKSWDNK